MTPFQAVFGREPPKVTRYSLANTNPPDVQHTLRTWDELLQKLQQNLIHAQPCIKKYVDQKRRNIQFEIGDLVYVKLQPYRQNSGALRKNQNLGMQYFSHFLIVETIGKVAYKLHLPKNARIYLVFHIPILKKCVGYPEKQCIPLLLLTEEHGLIVQPAKILDNKQMLHNDTWI